LFIDQGAESFGDLISDCMVEMRSYMLSDDGTPLS